MLPTQSFISASGPVFIKELEVSVTEVCSLQCAHCGFFVPQQPKPALLHAVVELQEGLGTLDRLGIQVGSLALVGGEATLSPQALAGALRVARKADNVARVELVTNGLTPKGLLRDALSDIDRLSLSDYTGDGALADAWRTFLSRRAPQVKFVVRRHGQWDQVSASVDLGKAGGQSAYETCWYRRHCVTLERRRLFVCSRIPKLGLDDQGLLLDDTTTAAAIHGYLNAAHAPAACRTCAQVAGLPQVAPGVQPDDRIARLRGRALNWFDRNLEDA